MADSFLLQKMTPSTLSHSSHNHSSQRSISKTTTTSTTVMTSAAKSSLDLARSKNKSHLASTLPPLSQSIRHFDRPTFYLPRLPAPKGFHISSQPNQEAPQLSPKTLSKLQKLISLVFINSYSQLGCSNSPLIHLFVQRNYIQSKNHKIYTRKPKRLSS